MSYMSQGCGQVCWLQELGSEVILQEYNYKNCYSEDGEQYMENKILENFKQFLYELKNLLGAAVLCSIAQQSKEAGNFVNQGWEWQIGGRKFSLIF